MEFLTTIANYPYLYLSCVAIVGLCVGSFLNVIIYRVPIILERGWQREARSLLELEDETSTPETFNLAYPNSRCPNCGHAIKPYENIPVISWLLLKGKCSDCKAPISVRYPVIELCTGILSGFIAFHFGFSTTAAAALMLTWFLIALTMIDYDHQLLPDNMTLPLMWIGLVLNYFGVFTDLGSALWGAVAGYGSLWLVFWAFKLTTGKEGMGYGDFKLLAALGAWLGWQLLPVIVILSSLVGAVLGIGLIVIFGRERSKPIPFGPFLAIAGWIALIYGDQLTQWYINTASL